VRRALIVHSDSVDRNGGRIDLARELEYFSVYETSLHSDRFPPYFPLVSRASPFSPFHEEVTINSGNARNCSNRSSSASATRDTPSWAAGAASRPAQLGGSAAVPCVIHQVSDGKPRRSRKPTIFVLSLFPHPPPRFSSIIRWALDFSDENLRRQLTAHLNNASTAISLAGEWRISRRHTCASPGPAAHASRASWLPRATERWPRCRPSSATPRDARECRWSRCCTAITREPLARAQIRAMFLQRRLRAPSEDNAVPWG